MNEENDLTRSGQPQPSSCDADQRGDLLAVSTLLKEAEAYLATREAIWRSTKLLTRLIAALRDAYPALSVVSAVPQEKKDQEKDHARCDHPRVISAADQRDGLMGDSIQGIARRAALEARRFFYAGSVLESLRPSEEVMTDAVAVAVLREVKRSMRSQHDAAYLEYLANSFGSVSASVKEEV